LKARYAGKLTPDQLRELVRLVATMTVHTSYQPSPFGPVDLSLKKFLARSRTRLPSRRETVRVTVMPDPQPEWQQRLPAIVVAIMVVMLVLMFILSGGRSGFSRVMDDMQVTVATQ